MAASAFSRVQVRKAHEGPNAREAWCFEGICRFVVGHARLLPSIEVAYGCVLRPPYVSIRVTDSAPDMTFLTPGIGDLSSFR